MEKPVLDLAGVSKRYDSLVAVDALDLSLRSGDDAPGVGEWNGCAVGEVHDLRAQR